MAAKYVFVTGGVVSGLGKGITAASLGRLLKQRGLKVTIQKFDPYLNVYPGLLSPYQHGEVYITDDGAETDLDLGHYERFIDESLTENSSVSAGKIYKHILENEEKGTFKGNTVQVVPHVTNDIKRRMMKAAKDNPKLDVVITEIGGTVGDIEGLPFLEAIRQVGAELGHANVMYVHVTLLPALGATGEVKTKPTQHSVRELLSTGIQPDVIVCRTYNKIDGDVKAKIALFCNIDESCVIENSECESLYEVPLMLHEQKLDKVVCKHLGLTTKRPNLLEWTKMVEDIAALETKPVIKIAIVAKYIELCDAYLSIIESLNHAGMVNGVRVEIKWISSSKVTNKNGSELLGDVQGIIVTGENGKSGIEGKLEACRFARENNIPYFGIRLGMHIAVIEYCRNVLGIKDAGMTGKNSVIHADGDKANCTDGIRLGAYPVALLLGSHAHLAYGTELVSERHRNRLEVNLDYVPRLREAGLVISGTSPDGKYVEIVELLKHKWFMGVLYHPEFKSRPNRPHPLFVGFIEAAIK
ncbi:MAG: CTP synthase [Firmicutes bacterium]|nr:CTP synthase [Bacillota bacterium]